VLGGIDEPPGSRGYKFGGTGSPGWVLGDRPKTCHYKSWLLGNINCGLRRVILSGIGLLLLLMKCYNLC